MFNRLMIFIQTFRREVLPYHLHRVTDWLADSSPMCPSACHSNNLIVTRVRKAAQEWKQLSIKLSTIPFRSTFCLPTGEWWARDVCRHSNYSCVPCCVLFSSFWWERGLGKCLFGGDDDFPQKCIVYGECCELCGIYVSTLTSRVVWFHFAAAAQGNEMDREDIRERYCAACENGME